MSNHSPRDFHKNAYDHHDERATSHATMMGHHEEGSAAHTFHKSGHESHTTMRNFHKACLEKAAADSMNKRADDLVPAVSEDQIRAVFLKMFGDVVMPSRISVVTPPPPAGVRLVPRPGQKEPEAPNVDPQFLKLVSVDNDEAPLR